MSGSRRTFKKDDIVVYDPSPIAPDWKYRILVERPCYKSRGEYGMSGSRRTFKKDDRVVYAPAVIPPGEMWAERVGRFGTIFADEQVDDWIAAYDRTVWVTIDGDSESISAYVHNLKHATSCAVCGTECSIDEAICPKCERDPNTQHVKCEPCDGTGTIETSEYGGQYEGIPAKCEDCDGHGVTVAPCLEDREAVIATIVKGGDK